MVCIKRSSSLQRVFTAADLPVKTKSPPWCVWQNLNSSSKVGPCGQGQGRGPRVCNILHLWKSSQRYKDVYVCVVCIGILRRDWQQRSLLGEIVNRAEPVICSRQPWKGTPDSQGSYWEFQRCLTSLGPGPHHAEPASDAPSRIRADQCAHAFYGAASTAPLPNFLCSHISSSILSHFLFLLCQLCIFQHYKTRLFRCLAFL